MKTSRTLSRRSPALRYVAAIGFVALALAARLALDPLLDDQLPFVTFFAGIAAAAWFGGLGPSILSMALGYGAAEMFTVHQAHARWIATSLGFGVTGAYFLVACIIVRITQKMHKARDSAIARQTDLEREIEGRVQAEEALRKARDEMRDQVQQRTAELNSTLQEREHDIAELHRAQARLSEQAALLQLAHDAIMVTDLDGKISFWNRGAEALYGWRSDQAVGQNVHALLQTALPISLDQVNRIVRGEGQWEGEMTHVTSGGQTVVVASRWSLLRDQAGVPVAVLEINRDVTDRKRAEWVLADKTAELERSNAELQQFAYVASHDLQEPLRMVSNFTQLLSQRYGEKLDKDAREFIGYAVEGATRMQTLIQDLLALSRVGTQGKTFASVPLEETLTVVLANLEFTIRESGAQVSHDELPVITADYSQMLQLLQNLVGNGIKFRSEGPPRVHVSAARIGNDWRFSVRDNGIGFESKYAERIFTVFQRLHAREEYRGNGIGLALCKKIVERHRGRIWAESEPGLGATFYFTIPVAGVPELWEAALV
jgi:PAS domain S-box-containing protein